MRKFPAVLMEAVLVAAAGLGLALAANAISPRGLSLSRDYFPAPGAGTNTPVANIQPPSPTTNSKPAAPLEPVLRRLQERGLQSIAGSSVTELFADPRYQQGLVVFVDARNDEHYQAGHIPAAIQFNHYRPEQHFATVLPACFNAQQVVVYCTGGACEDSEFAAIMLRDAGVPREKLFVYVGGVNEWKALGMPIETGARFSGNLVKPGP